MFLPLQIGRVIALKLALGGYNVVCCTTSKERFAALEQELTSIQEKQLESAARVGTLSMAGSVQEGARYKLWAVGKYDTSVRRDDIEVCIQQVGTGRIISV